jgi:nicotinamidase-related amidase
MTNAASTIDPATTALLVMDYQRGIVAMIEDSGSLLERAADAIARVRGRGGHIGYVRVAFTDDDLAALPPTSGMGARVTSSPEAFRAGSPNTAVHDRVAPQDGDIVVRKTRVGAFSTTNLDEQLRKRGIDTLILAGISTSGVRDYRLFVLADATADRDPEVHALLLEKVFPRQAEVVTVADLEGLMMVA